MTDFNVDNPYDPATSEQTPETLPLSEVIELAISKALYETHVMLPAVVTQVRGNQLVDIQPQLRRRYATGDLVTLPVIQNVPVQLLAGKTWWFKGPIAVGDVGMAIFSERSLDNWKVGGGFVDPKDPRKHHLADAVFIPGLASKATQVPGDPAALIIHNASAEIHALPGGKFKIKNDSNELLDLLVQLTQAIIDARINTIFGPQQVINFADFQDILDKLETLKG